MKRAEKQRVGSWAVSFTSILDDVNQLLAVMLEKHPRCP
jgi:hypothetical protein